MSTLQGARLLVAILLPRSQSFGRIAILNFANTINPGGDILSGGSDQEESIDYHYGFHNHAMLFSPSVVISRNDAGIGCHHLKWTSRRSRAGKVRSVLLHQTDGGGGAMKTRRVWNRRISQQRRDRCMNMGGAMHDPSTGWFLLFYGRRFSIHSWGCSMARQAQSLFVS
ncbi:hypothetical protein P692DRAFT_20435065 [Suillus brevipes Sb2]|nr:hypothetical protein P692DRAFT_20435065 [Suillus brevipes Sb2]